MNTKQITFNPATVLIDDVDCTPGESDSTVEVKVKVEIDPTTEQIESVTVKIAGVEVTETSADSSQNNGSTTTFTFILNVAGVPCAATHAVTASANISIDVPATSVDVECGDCIEDGE